MVLGKEFHSVGPATENDLAANVCLLVRGTIKDLKITIGPKAFPTHASLLYHFDKVGRGLSYYTLEHQCQNFILDSLPHWQPMKCL